MEILTNMAFKQDPDPRSTSSPTFAFEKKVNSSIEVKIYNESPDFTSLSYEKQDDNCHLMPYIVGLNVHIDGLMQKKSVPLLMHWKF